METVFDGKLILFAVSGVVILFLILLLFIPKIEKENRKRGVMIAVFRSNFVIFGIPVAISIYGDGNVGTTAMLIAVIVPLFNMLVVILEIFRGSQINIKNT
ncbi:MAG: hypothetical protein ACLTK8_01700 [Paeniclostridium sp.]